MKKLTTIILLLLMSFVYSAAQERHPKYEIRAVWLTTLGGLDWPKTYAMSASSANKQKKELTEILDKLQEAGINSILFQVRTRSAVLYPSKYEPWAPCVSGSLGKSPGYDPLSFAIEECHKRGMELHAWITTIPAGRWNSKECRHLRRNLPGIVKRNHDEGYLDPSNSKVAEYLSDICKEITERYDIDGIHLDYIRYPENLKLRISSAKARENITAIVRKIYYGVKSVKPWVKVSCSPIGKYSDLSRYSSHGWNARDRVYQDAQAWLEDGIMDLLFPMMYFRNENYYPFLLDWTENKHEGNVAAGLGAYMLSPKEGNWKLEDITRQMYVAREYESGYAFFRSKFFTDDTKGIYTFTKNIFNLYPALMPVTKCNATDIPQSPKNLDVKYSNSYYIISWDEGRTFDKSPYCTYNVYASDKYPVNTNDARNLIRWRKTDLKAAVKITSSQLYFAVTTCDRYGRESNAIQQYMEEDSDSYNMIKHVRDSVHVPEPVGDIEYIIVETLPGNIVSTKKYCKEGIDLKDIKPGIYILRTLNRRGVSHRAGVIFKK